jgi:hypothetical protein
MTFQIFKSVVDALPYNYADEIEKHRQALLAHRFIGDAAPTAPAMIEQAVRRVQSDGQADDFIADYTIIDDTPPVHEPSEAERRQMLIAAVRQAEQQASHAVIGPGKLRRLGLDVSRTLAKVEADRTDNDKAALATFAGVQARLDAVHYHAATLEAQIDDLTPDQLGNWTFAWNPD